MVGPAKTLFMDEISTGLDSSTTYLIVRCIRNYVTLLEVSCAATRADMRARQSCAALRKHPTSLHRLLKPGGRLLRRADTFLSPAASLCVWVCSVQATVMMSLLQPAPEVFDLFDDIMLLRWVGRLPKATPQWAASTRRKFQTDRRRYVTCSSTAGTVLV